MALKEKYRGICDFYPRNIELVWEHLKHFDKRRNFRNHCGSCTFAERVLSTANLCLGGHTSTIMSTAPKNKMQ